MISFTRDVYFQFIADSYEWLWPAPLVALGLMVLAAGLALRGAGPEAEGGWTARAVAALLALGWAACGMFHLEVFSMLNFMAPIYGWVFLLQAALLLWFGVVRGKIAFGMQGVAGWIGAALAVLAVVGWPLLDGLSGHAADFEVWGGTWTAGRLAGALPGPTVLLTLALLLLSKPARAWIRWALLAIPLTWAGFWGWHAWELGLAADWLPVVGGAAAVLQSFKRFT